MSSEPASLPRYDRTTIALHWGVALGVVFQWLGARAIDLFSPGPPRVDARSVHILVGTALTAAVAFRIWWRASRGRRLPADRRSAVAAASRAAHLGLYGLLIATLGLGLATAWIRGDSILGWFRIPAPGGIPGRGPARPGQSAHGTASAGREPDSGARRRPQQRSPAASPVAEGRRLEPDGPVDTVSTGASPGPDRRLEFFPVLMNREKL